MDELRTPQRQTIGRSVRRRRTTAILLVTLSLLVGIALLPGIFLEGTTHLSAQISPLSPLNAVDSSGPAVSLTGSTLFNVMASGQARLMTLAIILLAVIAGAAVLVWRQP